MTTISERLRTRARYLRFTDYTHIARTLRIDYLYDMILIAHDDIVIVRILRQYNLQNQRNDDYDYDFAHLWRRTEHRAVYNGSA